MNRQIEAPSATSWKPMLEDRYEAFLALLSVKGRFAVEKHDALESPERQSVLWRTFAGGLAKLASHATEVTGQHSVKFYIPDGKYKQQVFALVDTREGSIVVYFPDVVKTAISKKLLAIGATPQHYKIPGTADQLELAPIDAETRELTACKAMVGWGRRALRVEFGASSPEEHVHAVEQMCELAAQNWAAPKA